MLDMLAVLIFHRHMSVTIATDGDSNRLCSLDVEGGLCCLLAVVVAISLVDRSNGLVRSRSHLMVDTGTILGVACLSGIWCAYALGFVYSLSPSSSSSSI